MNVGNIFRRAVERRPNGIALIDASTGMKYDYQDWYNRACLLANALESAGYGPGTRVATAMRNRAELGIIFAATQISGAVFVPYNFRVSADELSFLVESANPDVLVFGESTADAVQDAGLLGSDLFSVAVDGGDADVTYETFLADAAMDFDPVVSSSDDPSVILYTGGTTGDPKAVPRTHENTYSAAAAHAIQAQLSRNETTLGLMSLSHTMGIHTLVAILLLGGTWIAQRSFDAEQTLSLIESETITSLYLVPTVYHDLLASDALASSDVSSIESIAFAGASMSPTMIRRVTDTFDPQTFVNHYGSTEVYTHSTCEYVDEKAGCAGKAGVNTRIRLVEPSEYGSLDPTDYVDVNELGEVIVDMESPEAFDGYLNQSQTERTVVDNWFFTGDLGYRDEEGDLFVVGRVDDMIISGGENIYPVEVENILTTHSNVLEAAVVGRPSERWNQTVAAFVTLVDDPQCVDFDRMAAELDEYCRESPEIASFKRPRKYFFIDSLVKSNVGKILRKELQKTDLDMDVYAEVDI